VDGRVVSSDVVRAIPTSKMLHVNFGALLFVTTFNNKNEEQNNDQNYFKRTKQLSSYNSRTQSLTGTRIGMRHVYFAQRMAKS
jgi:hypothetical protein